MSSPVGFAAADCGFSNAGLSPARPAAGCRRARLVWLSGLFSRLPASDACRRLAPAPVSDAGDFLRRDERHFSPPPRRESVGCLPCADDGSLRRRLLGLLARSWLCLGAIGLSHRPRYLFALAHFRGMLKVTSQQ